ncbi:MAG: shikimate dehydrogenase [Bacteroidetes bacterium]|nr:shikimate dehydrogenase [Bacteroidota bacterium]MDA0885684.1 shikimate dehydrogenase [Bacteroidota bacterium]MDA1226081.1 shikimate dehydrogenase [Bacteroidota bacterium]
MKEIKRFGLIGRNIDYSFSRSYFTHKFNSSKKLSYCEYINFDIQSINKVKVVFNEKNLFGLNVTIPYKQDIINYLDEVDNLANEIGAVNTICFENQKKIGYNTDIVGFKKTLELNSLDNFDSVIILGSGGASKTVEYFCKKNNVSYKIVSRDKKKNYLSYDEINKDILSNTVLIVNCTPVGTYPNIDSSPNLPYNLINDKSIFFDLVYNPEETLFIKKGKKIGCRTINGYQMLKLQADESWNLWQKSIK